MASAELSRRVETVVGHPQATQPKASRVASPTSRACPEGNSGLARLVVVSGEFAED